LEPSLSVIGAEHPEQALPLALQNLLPVATGVVPYEEAELLKYACNAFHALKVSFANEIGRIGKSMALDSARVMRLLCQDTRLNISSYYLRPGTPFGGSCLPKDVSALSVFARNQETSVPVIDSLLPSNERHLQALLEIVENRGSRRVFLLGLAFKAQTDDLRGSAMLELAAALLLKDFTVRIFDPLVSAKQLVGANERFARLRLPNLASLLTTDLKEAMENSDVIVASKPCVDPEILRPLLRDRHCVIDINGWPELANLAPNYEGFC
jgi:GDP-mannose 6-dehydrogenase